MAKYTAKSSAPSRIRFVMVEAELGDGDIGQITQAISNALRGPAPTATIKRIAGPVQQQFNDYADQTDAEGSDDEPDEAADALDASTKAMRQRVERKPAPTPEVLPIDFNNTEPTLRAFAAEHKVQSHQQRYLLAAAWFHEHGGVAKVTPAHIYTAYRSLKWPLTVKDFAQPLRDLKHNQFFGSTERGTYTINHIGLQRVAEMKTGDSG